MRFPRYGPLGKLIFPISSTIVDNLKRTERPDSNLVAFFYFNSIDAAKHHVRGLLSSILVQLCNKSKDCRSLLSQLYTEHNDGSEAPSEGALADCLARTLRHLEQTTVYLVVDALDECPNTTGIPSSREVVLRLVENLVKARYPNLHICVTSGLEQDIRNVLKPLISAPLPVSLHEESGQREDIKHYVNSFVQSDPAMGDWSAEDRDVVIKSLSGRAGGMYDTPVKN
jgi:hypothetical protein